MQAGIHRRKLEEPAAQRAWTAASGQERSAFHHHGAASSATVELSPPALRWQRPRHKLPHARRARQSGGWPHLPVLLCLTPSNTRIAATWPRFRCRNWASCAQPVFGRSFLAAWSSSRGSRGARVPSVVSPGESADAGWSPRAWPLAYPGTRSGFEPSPEWFAIKHMGLKTYPSERQSTAATQNPELMPWAAQNGTLLWLTRGLSGGTAVASSCRRATANAGNVRDTVRSCKILRGHGWPRRCVLVGRNPSTEDFGVDSPTGWALQQRLKWPGCGSPHQLWTYFSKELSFKVYPSLYGMESLLMHLTHSGTALDSWPMSRIIGCGWFSSVP